MAFNPAPNSWLPSWAEDGTTISVPIATFPELTAVEADGATGDIRKVVFAIMEKLNAKMASLAAADKPTKMRLLKSVNFDQANNKLTANYSVSVDLDIGSLEVTAES